MNGTLIPTSEEWLDIRVRLLAFVIFLEFIGILLQVIFLLRNEHFKLNFCGYMEYENLTPFQQQLRHESGKHAIVNIPKMEEIIQDTVKSSMAQTL
jgi:hypothetical protein